MADTLLRCRLCSSTCKPRSRPCAMRVPPPARIRRVATVASSWPSRSMRRSRSWRSAPELKVTRLRRSFGNASPTMKRTAAFRSSILFWLPMEPETSSTHTISMGLRSLVAAAAPAAAPACTVTKPKTLCTASLGMAEYSTRVLNVSGPSWHTSGSGSALALAIATELGGSSSSSWKFCVAKLCDPWPQDIWAGARALLRRWRCGN
mmetsp:Transcript_71026/g.169475  ORF Transcript_71026/g.169475 Transcript_71026/m.169475 type:complete len:206 (-) Transcript_71026:189-806(-)